MRLSPLWLVAAAVVHPALALRRAGRAEGLAAASADQEQRGLDVLRSIVRWQAERPRPWSKDELVVVPAVYERWGEFREQLQRRRPNEKLDLPRSNFLYQRFWEDEPFFVPNYGFEGAVYLRFIIDHYDDLPAVMLFVQDDYRFRGEEFCLRRDNLTYRDFHHLWIPHRPLWTWRNRGYGPAVEQCWRDFGRIFELDMPPRAELLVSFFCCNNFAVGREQVRRRPLAQWKAAYAKAIAPVCHEGPLDLAEMSDLTLSASGLGRNGVAFDQANLTKHTVGGALEHLASMIYGFLPMDGPEPNVTDRNCSDFLPRSVCPGSPCRA